MQIKIALKTVRFMCSPLALYFNILVHAYVFNYSDSCKIFIE